MFKSQTFVPVVHLERWGATYTRDASYTRIAFCWCAIFTINLAEQRYLCEEKIE